MTGKTREYLADLALQKGVVLIGVENFPQKSASKKIDELKGMPDATFEQLTTLDETHMRGRINAVVREIMKWTLTK